MNESAQSATTDIATVRITGREFEKQYFPFGGFLLITKDLAPKKVGLIHMADSVRDSHSKYMSTGVVVGMPILKVFENEYDKYLMSTIHRGDRVGFGTTVPLYSPSPAFYQFEGDDVERYVTLHVRDILCVICENDPKRIQFVERFKP